MDANLSCTQVRIHKPVLGKVWGLATLSATVHHFLTGGMLLKRWTRKIKNGNKTNPNHYPFSVSVPFFFHLSVPGRRSFPFSCSPFPPLELRWVDRSLQRGLGWYLQAKSTKAATGAKRCRSSCDWHQEVRSCYSSITWVTMALSWELAGSTGCHTFV